MQFELCASSLSQLTEIIELIKQFKIKSICLPNKSNLLSNLELAKALLKQLPDLDITLNFAVSNHYKKSQNILQVFQQFEDIAKTVSINRFLVVSGGQKKSVDSMYLLNKLAGTGSEESSFYCAYNPFLSDEGLLLENQRLISKLNLNLIKGVYLQVGSDLAKLRSGLGFIRQIDSTIPVYGSLLIPNRLMLNRFKFRPWRGVYLSDEYLNNLDIAEKHTHQIRGIYNDFNVLELVVIMPFTATNLIDFHQNYALL
ncbi:MAG: hypothetical protein AAGF07_02465 [Patescibacteria group bacterium]